MRPWRSGAEALRDRAAPARSEAAVDPPAYVTERLAELRLLHDVPFQYVVPDAALTPPESIRFFELDDGWTGALAEGALSVAGRTPELERARQARDRATGGVRDRRRGRPDAAREAVTGPITGFLLRSGAVARWPSMQVRAYSGTIPPDVEPDAAPDGVPLTLLRLDRVAPTALLALFAGVPTLVVLEEPHGNVVLGLAAREGGGWTIALRTAAGRLIEEDDDAVRIDAPLRTGAEDLGVVDVAALRGRLQQEAASRPEMPQEISPAALGLQLMRAPWRQRFGAPGNV